MSKIKVLGNLEREKILEKLIKKTFNQNFKKFTDNWFKNWFKNMFNTKSQRYPNFETFVKDLIKQLKLPPDFQLTKKYADMVDLIMATQTENHDRIMSCLF